MDTLAALGGTATVAELAEHLGRPADGLYYHLQFLSEAGLVVERRSDGNERLFQLAGRGNAPLRLAYTLDDGDVVEALRAYVRGLAQMAERDFAQALTPGTVVEGPRRELWAARNKGWVDAADLAEANALLERLCELVSQKREGARDRLMSFAFVMAPAPVRGKRRSANVSTERLAKP
ncbi:winged helix-turn-helix domain-containing protein [Silanimonas sp.]|uniref:winged helix-turn-helix domain-containing protein n=1 Tax=Silanimonas sp. TaxID=1929290 RepID=UPI0037CBD4BC